MGGGGNLVVSSSASELVHILLVIPLSMFDYSGDHLYQRCFGTPTLWMSSEADDETTRLQSPHILM